MVGAAGGKHCGRVGWAPRQVASGSTHPLWACRAFQATRARIVPKVSMGAVAAFVSAPRTGVVSCAASPGREDRDLGLSLWTRTPTWLNRNPLSAPHKLHPIHSTGGGGWGHSGLPPMGEAPGSHFIYWKMRVNFILSSITEPCLNIKK